MTTESFKIFMKAALSFYFTFPLFPNISIFICFQLSAGCERTHSRKEKSEKGYIFSTVWVWSQVRNEEEEKEGKK